MISCTVQAQIPRIVQFGKYCQPDFGCDNNMACVFITWATAGSASHPVGEFDPENKSSTNLVNLHESKITQNLDKTDPSGGYCDPAYFLYSKQSSHKKKMQLNSFEEV